MTANPVIAIFDVGKTNKKLFLFDQYYNIVYERSARLSETVDEDGEACENLESLRLWVFDSLRQVFKINELSIRAVNFCTYGASFVLVDEDGDPLTPLYDYLKAYPEFLKKQFYAAYGGEEAFSLCTASPVLGSLNSGLQLYRLRHEKPNLFKQVKYALHLPQYLSFLISGNAFSDITSIGCHTNLWDFTKNKYHAWVRRECIEPLLAPVVAFDTVSPAIFPGSDYFVGPGLHDSSAALIPYLISFNDPFVLISSGTWCITLNPFNNTPLTSPELELDCLCYIQYQGNPVKAARLFAGREHEEGINRIAAHFDTDALKYRSVEYDPAMIPGLRLQKTGDQKTAKELISQSLFAGRDLSFFSNDIEAYHQLMADIIDQQVASTSLVLDKPLTKKVFVDGGFSKNTVYMNLLAAAFPGVEVFAASMAQATALGAALSIHKAWNNKPLPAKLIELRYYAPIQ